MNDSKLINSRKDFLKSKIDFNNYEDDPMHMFNIWIQKALELDSEDPISFVLSTVSEEGSPSSRVVLLREISEEGIVFFTNYNSSKAQDIDCNPHVSANFYWKELEKQIKVSGLAHRISSDDSDRYFSSRPRESQLGAWASMQSSIINLDHSFESSLIKLENRFNNLEVDRPEYWGGYCVIPLKIEFWQGRPSRLHDRLIYEKDNKEWKINRLSP